MHLDVFSGPFELLLGLISKHKLDITEVALAKVTDDFVAHIKAAQTTDNDWDLGQASEFLLVAATLLDLKASRLLPQSGPQDDEDLALIEARDLLFARLLQYRAYKQIAQTFQRADGHGGPDHSEAGRPGPAVRGLLPELVITVTPEQLGHDRRPGMTPKAPPTVGLEHLHAPRSASGAGRDHGDPLSGHADRCPSAASSPTRTAPSSSWPGSSPCSSCSRRRQSPSSRPEALGARHPLDRQRAGRRRDRRRVRRGRLDRDEDNGMNAQDRGSRP